MARIWQTEAYFYDLFQGLPQVQCGCMVAQLAPHKFPISTILVEEYTCKKIVLVLMIVF